MKFPLVITLGIIAVCATALLFWPDLKTAKAQTSCQTFDAVGQLNLFTNSPLEAGDVWAGQVYVQMGDGFLRGLISGNDGAVDPDQQNNHRHGGMPTPGMTILGFDCNVQPFPAVSVCNDTIKIVVPNSIFGPAAPGFAQYQGNSAYINGGTGRFEHATGDVTLSGPYIFWRPSLTSPPSGAYNPEIHGHICGVE